MRSQIDKVLEITSKENLIVIAISRGASIVLLALAMDEDYYVNKISKVIALSPCLYTEIHKIRPGGVLDYQGVVDFY